MRNSIADIRQAAGVSQAQLAEQVGVSRRVIQAWEAQKYEPGSYKLFKIAQTLNCKMEDLIIVEEGE